MDEKTEALRDIFIDATGSETVTDRQEASRGSIADDTTDATDDELLAVLDRFRDRFDFRSSLDDDALLVVLRGFFAGASDATIADELDDTERAVFTARMDLHLVTDDDHTPVDAAVRPLVRDGADLDTCLDRVDADAELVERAYHVAVSETAAARTNHRFPDAFSELLTDDDISTRLATDARRDGLRDATEDIETDVSL